IQVAVCLLLLAGAALFIRSVRETIGGNVGFDVSHLATATIAPSLQRYTTERTHEVLAEVRRRVLAVPGVSGASWMMNVPLSGERNRESFQIDGRERITGDSRFVRFNAVGPSYFSTMGIPMRNGREFEESDRIGAPLVAIVNEAMAKRFWPDGDALGKRFTYGQAGENAEWLTIIGVVDDMRRTGYDAPVRYETFLPLTQVPASRLTLVIRAARNPLALSNAVRAEVRRIDSELPIYDIATVDELLSGMVAQRRFSMALLGTFATIALVLGIIGVYSVTAFLVAQRTREVGVRIALGAQPDQLVRTVVAQGMVVAVAGLVAGLVGALLLSRAMAALLYQVSPRDMVTLASVTILLTAATLLANYLPARRAARVDPLVALRNE
ncbi:MAG TPA: FtsX-like permease family protein, partial [Gemmatimonadaceae bacterium]|nr:FtsX-like permease family protein [Gemmatimonadaceae bacterium]